MKAPPHGASTSTHTVDLLLNDKTEKLPTSMESLEASITKLQTLVDKTYEYVDAVAVR